MPLDNIAISPFRHTRKPEYTTTNLRLPSRAYEELRYQARRRGTSVAMLVREAVAQYLGHEGPADEAEAGNAGFDRMIGAVDTAVTDESAEHDHYLYGWPKEGAGEDARGRDSTRTRGSC